jgi:phosphohistidine phosphatase
MSLQVILVRHALAEERDGKRWPDDRKRPLSREGRGKFDKVAAGLVRWIPDVDRLLTSPLKRTRETAEILRHHGWPRPEDLPELAPQSSPTALIHVLKAASAKRIALVGHEPDLSVLVATCILGSGAHAFSKMKKGSVICIYYPGEVRAGTAVLTEFVPPRLLTRYR